MNHFLIPEPKGRRSGGTLYDMQMVETLQEKGYEIKVHWIEKNVGVKAFISEVERDDHLIIDGLVFHQNYKDAYLLKDFKKIYLTHLPFWLEPGISEAEIELRKLRELSFIKKCKILLCTSNYIHDIMINNGIPNEKIKVIIPRLPVQTALKRIYNKVPKELLVVGGVHYGKGLDILVKALGHLKNSNWTLNIVGGYNPDDSYFKSIIVEIKELGLSSKISFLGERNAEQIIGLYKNSDLLIHPSRFESYGMSVGEALCYGLPVLSSDAGALPSVYASTPVRFFKSANISSLTVLVHSLLKPEEYQIISQETAGFIFKVENENGPEWNIYGLTNYLR